MTTFKLPDLGEGLPEAEIVRWHVRVGDRVKVDQPMVAVETAKAVVEVPSPYSGTIKALHGQPGDVIHTGAPLVDFELEGSTEASPPTQHSGTVVGVIPSSEEVLVESAVAGHVGKPSRDRVRAAPAVRMLAKRMRVDLARLRGSGRGGLITIDDVLSASGTQSATTPQIPHSAGEPEKLRGLRRAMAQSMALARDNVASCTLFDDADLHSWQAGNDYTLRLLRAIAAGCKAEPGLNAWYDGASQSRYLIEKVDIGIAVDTPEGLLVPVIRDVGRRAADELRRDIDRLKQAARDRTVAAEELRDFTFMLSNFGMIAGRYATPVVVPPAVAILGAGRLSRDVVAVGDSIEAHLRMPLSLTFDHRCVTGGEAARFLAAVRHDLEQSA